MSSAKEQYPMAQPVYNPSATYAAPREHPPQPTAPPDSRHIASAPMYGIPYQVPMEHTIPENMEITESMLKTHQLSQIVKIVSMIDIFFSCFYLFVSPLYLIRMIFPIMGWQGARDFHSCKVFTYYVYQLLDCILKLASIVYYLQISSNSSSGSKDVRDDNNQSFNIFFNLIFTFLALYIARFSYLLYN